MKAKEYLMQLKKFRVAITQKQEELRMIRQLGENQIPFLQDEINGQMISLMEKQHQIIDEIQKLNNDVYMEILYRRYVKMENMTTIAYEMGYNYTWICELHGFALQDFEKTVMRRTEDNRT